MKKKFHSRKIIELTVIILVCLFLLWLNISHVLSRLNGDMMSQIEGMEEKFEEVSENYERINNNYNLIQKHFARLGAYYLGSSSEPYSRETLSKIRETLEAEEVYIMDPEGKILFSSGKTGNKALSDDLLDTLLSVSADHPFSEVVMDVEGDTPEDIEEPAENKEAMENEKPADGEEAAENEEPAVSEKPADSEEAADGEKALEGEEPADGEPAGEEIETNEGEGFLPDELKGEDDQDSDISDSEDIPEEGIFTYCSSYMDPGHIFVFCDNYSDYSSSANKALDGIDLIDRARYGSSGFFFFVTEEGNVSLPKNLRTGSGDMEKADIPGDRFYDGYSGFITLHGNKYYCCVKKFGEGESLLACALPLKELFFTLFFVSIVAVILVLISLLLIQYYARMMLTGISREINREEFIRSFRNRLLVLTLLCACVTAGISIYSYTLYLYSFSLSKNVQDAEDLHYNLNEKEVRDDGSDQYLQAVTVFTRSAGLLISEDPSFLKREKLKSLVQVLGADHVLVYDRSGRVTASDENYTGLVLSEDPQDMSNEFTWVLRKDMVLVQDQVDEVFLDEPYLFSGVTLRDEKGDYQGMVQLAMSPSFRENMVAPDSIKSDLSSYSIAGSTISMAVDKNTKEVISPYVAFDGLLSEELGLTKKELRDGYTGFFTIFNRKVIGCCKTSGSYWVILGSFTDQIPLMGVKNGLMSALPGIMTEILFCIFLLLTVNNKGSLIIHGDKGLFRNKKTEEAKAEAYIFRLIGGMVLVLTAGISLVVFAGSILFKKNTVGYFIFVYPWAKDFHIFTVNRCLITICIVAFVLYILLYLLGLLVSLLSSRQETVIRLFLSFIRYFGWMGTLYYCMTLLGVPTISLLASAGALTAVFSVGAQNIVADILAGLFIIFEGSFKVGDMITVDDWHGQVQEIGIRNTTIRDLAKNDIKILNNSTIKRVVNFSVHPSFCAIAVGIEYGMDLKELEAIIEKEIPVMKENLGDRISMFRYLGVDEFADSSVIIKFEVACKNQEILKVRRALNREVKLMFDRNGIQVPFPQLVLHDGEEKNI